MSTCGQKMLSLLDKGRVKIWSFELYDCGICKKKCLCLEGKSDLHKSRGHTATSRTGKITADT